MVRLLSIFACILTVGAVALWTFKISDSNAHPGDPPCDVFFQDDLNKLAERLNHEYSLGYWVQAMSQGPYAGCGNGFTVVICKQ
jgi:hypothetical protein